MTLTRGRKLALAVLSVLAAWLVVWTVLAAVAPQREGKVGPATPHVAVAALR